MSEPLLSLISLILQQHDKVSPDHSKKHVRCCHGFSERWFLCISVCLHEAVQYACGGEFDGCMCGCWGGNYKELVANVPVKLISGK